MTETAHSKVGSPAEVPAATSTSVSKALLREAAARRFSALSHPTRLRLLELLARGAKSVNELASLSGEHPNTVSKHLRALAAVRLLRRAQDGCPVSSF